ncbi:hypothetical protein [Ensifer canadensis]
MPRVEAILEREQFGEALRDVALRLVAMHDVAPRIVRYTANLQKWLLTQAILTLHFEHKTDASRPGLTAAKLIDFFVANNVASKNTAVAHLAEMRSYRLLLDAEWSGDKRLRPLIVADTAESLIRQWFDGHLKSLDRLDGGEAAPSVRRRTVAHAFRAAEGDSAPVRGAGLVRPTRKRCHLRVDRIWQQHSA